MLRITIIAIGKKHDKLLADAIEHYQGRLQPHCQLQWRLVASSDVNSESAKLLSLSDGSVRVLLDERGGSVSSQDIAMSLESWMNHAQNDIAIIIGGAYGATNELHERADHVWSLGNITLPHQLVRLVLLEQLYRGFSILSGSNYHHE